MQGVGLPAVRRTARHAGSGWPGGSATTSTACSSRSRGRPARRRVPGRAASGTRRRWPRSSGSRVGRGRRAATSGVHDRGQRRAGGARHALVSPDTRHLRRLPARAGRPGRSPLRLPVRQLHELRAAVHDRARRALRPAADDDGGLRRCAPACAAEYHDPADRRFHAQPVCCPACGPRLRLLDAGPAPSWRATRSTRCGRGCCGAGRVLAVKGLGGYHLAVLAGDEAAAGDAAASASTARTSRSRSWWPTWTRPRDAVRGRRGRGGGC